MISQIKELFLFNLRLLMFRTTREEFTSFSSAHLIFGLCCTWIVGMGRWWDDPDAVLAQHLGLGSIAYIFVLAAIIWLLVLPLRPKNWSYKHVLTFVSLTSLPALLYAIPVEQFLPLSTAATVNVCFLGVVALWRVSLYFFYLRRHAALVPVDTAVVGLLPLSAIVTSLFALNLHRVVFNIMGSMKDGAPNSHEGEYAILFLLVVLSVIAIIPLAVLYLAIVVHAGAGKSQRS